MKKHKHYDVIVAWAEGQKVQYRPGEYSNWINTDDPTFATDFQWRIKPQAQVIKHRRWLYKTGKSYGISLHEPIEHYNPERDNQHFVEWIDEDWIEYEVTE